MSIKKIDECHAEGCLKIILQISSYDVEKILSTENPIILSREINETKAT